jgi:hypothetical protein
MGVFAAMTLIIGVYPDIFLNPINDYIGGMFEDQEGVLPVPVHAEGSGQLTNLNPPAYVEDGEH